MRVGWGYGSKKIVDALNVIKPPFNVNGIAQLAAIESLKDKAFINKSIRHNLLYSKKIKKFLNNIIFLQIQFQQIFCYLILKIVNIQQNIFMKNLKIRELF